jgi:parvulin-like peptidyl-prolyl isomerase
MRARGGVWDVEGHRPAAPPRLQARSHDLARVRAGESMDALMAEYSEDQGSAATAKSYTVTADAGLVFEFKRLGLRLDAGEAGLVKTEFGWHIIKRVE